MDKLCLITINGEELKNSPYLESFIVIDNLASKEETDSLNEIHDLTLSNKEVSSSEFPYKETDVFALFVNSETNEVVGKVKSWLTTWGGLNTCWIPSLYVLEPYRRSGLGRRLVTRIMEYAKAEGVEAFMIDSWEHDPQNKAFYERMGFKSLSTCLIQTVKD